jgi:hypothetical protein
MKKTKTTTAPAFFNGKGTKIYDIILFLACIIILGLSIYIDLILML